MQPSFSFLGHDVRFFMFLVQFVFWKINAGAWKNNLASHRKINRVKTKLSWSRSVHHRYHRYHWWNQTISLQTGRSACSAAKKKKKKKKKKTEGVQISSKPLFKIGLPPPNPPPPSPPLSPSRPVPTSFVQAYPCFQFAKHKAIGAVLRWSIWCCSRRVEPCLIFDVPSAWLLAHQFQLSVQKMAVKGKKIFMATHEH